MYAIISNFLRKYVKPSTIFKYGFNISPMYRRSTGRIMTVSEDLLQAKVKIPITYKNKNYVGSIFGGSLFAATDPVYMIQLIHILGNDYVVWDKEATIKFKRPAVENAYADFCFSEDEIETLKKQVAENKEIDIKKELQIVNKDATAVYAEVTKIIYVADKKYYKEKRGKKK